HTNHFLDLLLISTTEASQRLLDLHRRILSNLEARLHGSEQYYTAGLRDRHGSGDIARKEQFFYRHFVGLGIGDDTGQFIIDRLQTHRVVLFDRRTDHASVHEL